MVRAAWGGYAAGMVFMAVRLTGKLKGRVVGVLLTLAVVIMPLMIPHYLLAAAAILGPKPLLWPVLIVDSLLVGWLSAVLAAASYYAVVRAAGKAGVSLVPAA